jgi:uncharacterized protein (DUF2267 family)
MTERPNQIDSIEKTVHATMEWIHAMGVELGQQHPPLAFRCLRAGLHAIRDRLPVVEAAGLGAQLPMLLRGAYYEGWAPGRVPTRARTLEELADNVSDELRGGLAAAPMDVLRATLSLLAKRVDRHEVVKIRSIMPEPVREAWTLPDEARPAEQVRAPS